MRSAAKNTLRLAFFLAASVPWSLLAQQAATQDSVQIAEEEAVRRQEKTIQLHITLEQAQAAQKRNQLVDAAKLYQQAVADIPDVQVGNPAVDLDKRQAVAGLDVVREKLARQAIAGGDMAVASAQVEAALKVDPNNESLIRLREEIDKRIVDQRGSVPSPDLIKTIPVFQKEKVDIGTKLQNAKLLYEMGRYDDAEITLKQVIKLDPSNKTAAYYMDLVQEARFAANARARDASSKASLDAVEHAWILPNKQEGLPIPNPMAMTNLVYTSEGRQAILSKLERIRLNEVSYDLPLTEVLNRLRTESQKRDPDGVGINFLINPHADAAVGAFSQTDTTGNV